MSTRSDFLYFKSLGGGGGGGGGGRVSDVYLTEDSGLLDHLLPGDMMLADRGFTIEESAGTYCATVKVPTYTKGKKQLSQLEVDKSKQLSSVRIHIEQILGVLRQKYTIYDIIFSSF